MNFFSRERAGDIYFTGLLLLVIGLPLSLFLTSISQFIIAASFVIEKNYRQRLQQFLLNLPALAITGIYLMHLIGLFWTENFSWGLHDLKVKLPLLLLPFLISTAKPLTKKQFETVMTVFVFAVFTGSLIAFAVLTGIINRPINDIRDIFIFHISHIRFALLTCVSIFSTSYFLYANNRQWSWVKKIIAALLVIWFVVFLILAESMTGLSILIVTMFMVLLRELFRKRNLKAKILLSSLLIGMAAAISVFISKSYNEINIIHAVDLSRLDSLTSQGNKYANDTVRSERENGYLIWIYVCDEELKQAWNERSKFSFDSLDMRGQPLRYTLIRFLASIGHRRDADGVIKLSEKEIQSIERGIANVNYQNMASVKARLQQIFSEYDYFIMGENPGGHSVVQRMEFWRAAYGIFRENYLFGVGTGDITDAYPIQYEKMNSRLIPQWRLRAHNQYLTFAATFGIIGFLYFIFALVFPMHSLKKSNDFLFITFWLISILSMISEDTLETQAGITFFTFFNCLFLFSGDDGE
ncbi:MAG: O-antigen ligase family protein [Bacteroidia bacterium]|nr:O-antigen ligase family protein [Bacteroidia bacterium]